MLCKRRFVAPYKFEKNTIHRSQGSARCDDWDRESECEKIQSKQLYQNH